MTNPKHVQPNLDPISHRSPNRTLGLELGPSMGLLDRRVNHPMLRPSHVTRSQITPPNRPLTSLLHPDPNMLRPIHEEWDPGVHVGHRTRGDEVELGTIPTMDETWSIRIMLPCSPPTTLILPWWLHHQHQPVRPVRTTNYRTHLVNWDLEQPSNRP